MLVDVTMIGSEYELDILHLRVNILKEVVDEFIVVESNLTYSGKPKAEIFQSYRERPWYGLHPITFVSIEQDPNVGPWVRENEQRRCTKEALFQVTEGEFDGAIIADLDEVPDPELLKHVDRINGSFRPVLWMHYFHLNTPVKEYQRWWKGPLVLTRTDAELLDYQDTRMGDVLPEIEDGGWHWSSCLTRNGVIEKMYAFAHTEYANREAMHQVIHNYVAGKSIHGEELEVNEFDHRYPTWLQNCGVIYKHLIANV